MLSMILALLLATQAHAQRWDRQDRNIKLPDQEVVEKQGFDNVAAAGTTQVLNGHAGATSTAAVVVTSFLAQPDLARNLVITPGGTTADVGACTIVVAGKNYWNRSFSESFAFIANQSTAITGGSAFKSITSITFPANCEDTPFNATWSVGLGEKLGLQHCMAAAGDFLFSTLAGSKESNSPTMAVDVDEVEKNTANFDGTYDGVNDFTLRYFQNFRCPQ